MAKVRVHGASGVTSINGATGAVGLPGNNILLNSGLELKNADYRVGLWRVAQENLEVGKTYTVTYCTTPALGTNFLTLHKHLGSGNLAMVPVIGGIKQIASATFTLSQQLADAVPGFHPACYRSPNDGTVTGETIIHWAMLTEGTFPATRWVPAPEEIIRRLEALEAKNGITYEPPVIEGPDFDGPVDGPEILMGGVILPIKFTSERRLAA